MNQLASLPAKSFDNMILLNGLKLEKNPLMCCAVVEALSHVDTDTQAAMGGSCMDPKRVR